MNSPTLCQLQICSRMQMLPKAATLLADSKTLGGGWETRLLSRFMSVWCITLNLRFLPCSHRRLQEEEQQYRTSSLPAIPNPFPELCSPAGSPTLSTGSLPQCQPTGKYVRGPSLALFTQKWKFCLCYFLWKASKTKCGLLCSLKGKTAVFVLP